MDKHGLSSPMRSVFLIDLWQMIKLLGKIVHELIGAVIRKTRTDLSPLPPNENIVKSIIYEPGYRSLEDTNLVMP